MFIDHSIDYDAAIAQVARLVEIFLLQLLLTEERAFDTDGLLSIREAFLSLKAFISVACLSVFASVGLSNKKDLFAQQYSRDTLTVKVK
jgi:hypothetical protein